MNDISRGFAQFYKNAIVITIMTKYYNAYHPQLSDEPQAMILSDHLENGK